MSEYMQQRANRLKEILDKKSGWTPKERREAESLYPEICNFLFEQNAALRAEVESIKAELEDNACSRALDAIVKLCGVEDWEYPAQVVRDVEQLRAELERVRTEKFREIDLYAIRCAIRQTFLDEINQLQRELDEAKRNGHCCDGFGGNCPREERRRRQEAHDKRHPS